MTYRERSTDGGTPAVVEADRWWPDSASIPGVERVELAQDGGYARPGEGVFGVMGYLRIRDGEREVVGWGHYVVAEPDGLGHFQLDPEAFLRRYAPVE